MKADIDAELVKVMSPIMDLPGRLRYRETMPGKVETAEITKYTDLLIAIRRTHRHMSKQNGSRSVVRRRKHGGDMEARR